MPRRALICILCLQFIVAGNVFDCTNPKDGTEKADGERCRCIEGAKKEERVLRFVHVPKCGTTFWNTVYSLACDDIPKYAAMRGDLERAPHGMMVVFYHVCFPKVQCRFDGGRRMNQGHKPIHSFTPSKVAYLTMLREPFQRLVSGFDDGLHDCGQRCRGKSILHYGQQVQGIYAKFLLGSTHYDNASLAVSVAIHRLERFAFVGILEHWDLSICLCHAIFGYARGFPIKAEFAAVRASSKHNPTTLQVRSNELRSDAIQRAHNGDHFALVDRDIYDAGLHIFRARLQKQQKNISSSCRSHSSSLV